MTIRRSFLLLLLVAFFCTIVWILSWSVPLSDSPEDVSVVLGGDFYAGERLQKYGLPEHPEKFTRGFPDVIEESDLHIVNLEAPLTTSSDTTTSKRYWLRTPPDIGTVLLDELSVDAVGLANNHLFDYGEAGFEETVEHLNQIGVRHTGAARDRESAESPVYFERGGQTVAFLAFSNTYPQSFWASAGTPGTAYGDPDRVRSAVRRAEKMADRVMVSFHWGRESERETQKYQRQLARLTIRSGADVVFGHHPHTLQSVEQYQDGLIFYSLGNYFFSTLSHDVQYGLLAEISFPSEPSDPKYSLHLMHVNNYKVHYRPRHVGRYDDALGVGLKLGRLGFFRRTADVSPKPPRVAPRFSSRTGVKRP